MIQVIILGYICLLLITYLIVKRIFKPGIRHVEGEWFYISERTTTKTAIMAGILWPLTLIGAILIGILYILGFKLITVKKY